MPGRRTALSPNKRASTLVESVFCAVMSFIHSFPLRPTSVSRPHIGTRGVESTATDDLSVTVCANDDGTPVPRKRTAMRTGTCLNWANCIESFVNILSARLDGGISWQLADDGARARKWRLHA